MSWKRFVRYNVLMDTSIASMTKYVYITPLRTPSHAGISLRNFLVADYLLIMLCNFSGLAIGDWELFIEAEDRHRLSPEDIFGLGCLVREISIGSRPEIDNTFHWH